MQLELKRQTQKMMKKLLCSKRRNQLNVQAVHSGNQEQVFLGLNQLGASNFILFIRNAFFDKSALSYFAFYVKRLQLSHKTSKHANALSLSSENI